MKFSEIATKSKEDLHKELTELREKFNTLKIKSRLGQVKNTNELKTIRKDIARVLTALSALKIKS